jgi:carboxyl-terminal processing protease
MRFLPLIFALPLLAQPLTIEQRREVFESAWTFVRDNFYDPKMRGVAWSSVRDEFAARLPETETAPEMRTLLRGMLARLRQSHLSVLTRDEFRRSRIILPFVFEQRDGRVFLTHVMQRKDGSRPSELQPGDEILSVDGQPAIRMRLPEVTHLDEMDQNPYTGAEGSTAEIRVKRQGKELTVGLARVNRLNDLRQSELTPLANGGLHIRLFSAGEGTIDAPDFWPRLSVARYLVLDMRYCAGGDHSFSGRLLGALLGAGVEVQKNVTRDGVATPAMTKDPGVRYRGPVALLIGPNAESEPEAIAAALREYQHARLFGSNTRGAWSGNSIATGLPHGVGLISVPRTRSVSPKGRDYEQTGVAPHVRVSAGIADLERRRDVVLERAVLWQR